VPTSYALSVPEVSARAAAYNIPGVTIDGTDVLAVYEATAQAVQRARTGGGPTLIECMTYRWRGHSEQRGNAADPRPPEAVTLARQHDPLAAFGAWLQEQRMATPATLTQVEHDVQAAVEEAIAFAKASPLPKPEDALQEVFAP
jgi:TPP-dependent pyruvate/acetoin dehydrogenase alpha subunit